MTEQERIAFMNWLERKSAETTCEECPLNIICEKGCIWDWVHEIVTNEGSNYE